MFVAADVIKKKTPKNGINRERYINLLVNEFFETSKQEAKEQICCNLANFAYDPINFIHLKKSNALKLFLKSISCNNDNLVIAGITGICNFCLDPEIKNDLITEQRINCIKNLLKSYNVEIILKTVTTLILIIDDKTLNNIVDLQLVSQIILLNQSENIRIKNLTTLFLTETIQNNIS